MYTFVTAFVDLNELEPRPSRKSRRIYLDMAESLLPSGINFVCFCQPENKSEVETIAKSRSDSIYIADVKLDDLRRKHEEVFFAKLPRKRDPVKDTHWYLAITHHKIHWMQKAAEINPFNTRDFCWIDFGINHIIHAGPERFNELLRPIDPPPESQVICGSLRTPNAVMSDMSSYVNDFDATHVAGTVLAMRNCMIEWFATQQDEIIAEILASQNLATWEATVWGIMTHRFPERFRVYEVTGWNESLLINFPRRLSNACGAKRTLPPC
jgi:hypothetical protein